MTEVTPTFGIKKSDELNQEIVEFLEEYTNDFGEQKIEEIYIFINGEKYVGFAKYKLFYAYINIDDLWKLEKLLRKHHPDYCLLCNSAGG